MDASSASAPRPAGLWRIFGACVYDGLLCIALLMVAGTVAVAANAGNAIPPDLLAFKLFLLAVPFPYFAWCWVHGGQTLGMRAWRLRIEGPGGGPMTVRAALLRYVGALLSLTAFGLGFFWVLAPPHLSWHDRISDSRLLREA